MTLHVAFWHADGTPCAHGWPPGTTPPAVTGGDAELVRHPAGLPACADGRELTHYSITQVIPDPGPAAPAWLDDP